MAVEDKRETRDTVIIEKDSNNSSPVGWIIGLIILALLVIAFFYYGGFGLFGGSSTNEGGDVNITVPENIEVQTPNSQ
jgi:hypothetical protein